MLLARRFIRPKRTQENNSSEPPPAGWLVGMFALILVIALAIRFWQWLAPAPTLPILPDVPGLVEVSSIADASARAGVQVIAIPEMEGVRMAAIGVYVMSSEEFPIGSLGVALARGDHRFVEILERPNTSLEKEAERFALYEQKEIVLAGSPGILIDLQKPTFDCREKDESIKIGLCEITKVLLFEVDEVVISIGADGRNATEGELITMAKAMIEIASE